jgi:hypothetical protein
MFLVPVVGAVAVTTAVLALVVRRAAKRDAKQVKAFRLAEARAKAKQRRR